MTGSTRPAAAPRAPTPHDAKAATDPTAHTTHSSHTVDFTVSSVYEAQCLLLSVRSVCVCVCVQGLVMGLVRDYLLRVFL